MRLSSRSASARTLLFARVLPRDRRIEAATDDRFVLHHHLTLPRSFGGEPQSHAHHRDVDFRRRRHSLAKLAARILSFTSKTRLRRPRPPRRTSRVCKRRQKDRPSFPKLSTSSTRRCCR